MQLAREPYTWAALVRRGRQRRSFVHLYKKLLRRGEKSLSEVDRVSLAQVSETLTAQDQLLFEQLAASQAPLAPRLASRPPPAPPPALSARSRSDLASARRVAARG